MKNVSIACKCGQVNTIPANWPETTCECCERHIRNTAFNRGDEADWDFIAMVGGMI